MPKVLQKKHQPQLCAHRGLFALLVQQAPANVHLVHLLQTAVKSNVIHAQVASIVISLDLQVNLDHAQVATSVYSRLHLQHQQEIQISYSVSVLQDHTVLNTQYGQ